MFAELPDGYQLFYRVYDKKFDKRATTIIFLHGGPGIADHSIYVDFWKKLQDQQTQVIFIDMRGHGQSAEKNQEMGTLDNPHWNLKQWGKDLHDFIEILGIHSPIIAGVSFGGWVGLSYAIQYPAHASGLILCATEARVDVEERIAAYKRIGIARGEPELGERAAKIVSAMAHHPSEQSSKNYKEICIPLFSTNPYSANELANMKINIGPWIKFNSEEYYKFNFLPALKTISARILLLVGKLDPEHPEASAREACSHMNQEKVILKVIEDAGAPPYRDEPEEVLKILRDFIVKVKAS